MTIGFLWRTWVVLGCLLAISSMAQNPDSIAVNKRTPSDSSHFEPKRSFNHKEQVIVGSLIMTGLALILVSMNNYNPK